MLQRVSKRFQWISGPVHSGVSAGFLEVSEAFHVVPGGYRGYEEVSKVLRRVSGSLQGVLRLFQGLPGVTEAFHNALKDVSEELKGSQGVSRTFLRASGSFGSSWESQRRFGGFRGVFRGSLGYLGNLREF